MSTEDTSGPEGSAPEDDFDDDEFGSEVPYEEGGTKVRPDGIKDGSKRKEEEPKVYGPSIGRQEKPTNIPDPFEEMWDTFADSSANTMARQVPVETDEPRYDRIRLQAAVKMVARQIRQRDHEAAPALFRQYADKSQRAEALQRFHNVQGETIAVPLSGRSATNYFFAVDAVLAQLLADAVNDGEISGRVNYRTVSFDQFAVEALERFAQAEGLEQEVATQQQRPSGGRGI